MGFTQHTLFDMGYMTHAPVVVHHVDPVLDTAVRAGREFLLRVSLSPTPVAMFGYNEAAIQECETEFNARFLELQAAGMAPSEIVHALYVDVERGVDALPIWNEAA